MLRDFICFGRSWWNVAYGHTYTQTLSLVQEQHKGCRVTPSLCLMILTWSFLQRLLYHRPPEPLALLLLKKKRRVVNDQIQEVKVGQTLKITATIKLFSIWQNTATTKSMYCDTLQNVPTKQLRNSRLKINACLMGTQSVFSPCMSSDKDSQLVLKWFC